MIECNGKTTYECQICQIKITYKKNIKNHLTSKRHAQGKKENISTNDETVQVNINGREDVEELNFCRRTDDDDKNRKGKHFMVETQKPVKYKFGCRIGKYMHVCKDCAKTFRNAGLLRRHRLTDAHRQMAKTMIQIGARQYQRKIYQTRKRTKLEKNAKLFEAVAVSNEFSVTKDRFPHSHSHLYLRTTEGHLFKDMKKLLRKHFAIKANDIVRPINIRQCIKYITKQDQNAIVINIPLKFTSVLYQAQIYREHGHSKVNWGDFIPSQVGPADRKIFEENVRQEAEFQNSECLQRRVEGLELRPWQKEAVKIAEELEGDERAVLWFTDEEGGQGKSKLCQYLAERKGAAIFHDMSYIHNTFIYRKESYVVFDLPRGYTCSEMRLVEDLKNGIINVQKYESKRMIFDPPVVIVFSNTPPNLALLSLDRWHVYAINKGPLYLTRYI